MRAFRHRSRPAGALVVLVAVATVLSLVHAATAGDDLGIRPFPFWPLFEPAPVEAPAPAAPPVARHHAPRRIWAASRSRPLRITLARRRHHARLAAAAHRPKAPALARRRPSVEPRSASPRLVLLPTPTRPALVSLYQDRTLRTGDAVMLADGIHVFRGQNGAAHRPEDFVRLAKVATFDWRLRRTLDDLDSTPPIRWSALDIRPI